MEACDKQFEIYEGHDLPKDPLDVYEDAWRDALEWAESKKLTHNPQVIPTYAIKKELEDK